MPDYPPDLKITPGPVHRRGLVTESDQEWDTIKKHVCCYTEEELEAWLKQHDEEVLRRVRGARMALTGDQPDVQVAIEILDEVAS